MKKLSGECDICGHLGFTMWHNKKEKFEMCLDCKDSDFDSLIDIAKIYSEFEAVWHKEYEFKTKPDFRAFMIWVLQEQKRLKNNH